MVTVNVKLEPTICRTGGEDTNHVHVFQAFLTCWPEILLSKKDLRPSTVKREL
jgi:hypothetical protein